MNKQEIKLIYDTHDKILYAFDTMLNHEDVAEHYNISRNDVIALHALNRAKILNVYSIGHMDRVKATREFSNTDEFQKKILKYFKDFKIEVY